MRFEWDATKVSTNEIKHGVAFAEAATVFGDWASLTISGPKATTEQRWVTLGRSSRGRLSVVVHADRAGSVRIISARRATATERRSYESEE